MKKLTAGIFTVLMGLVSVNAADAAVASKGYVDNKFFTKQAQTEHVAAQEAIDDAQDVKINKNIADIATNAEKIGDATFTGANYVSSAEDLTAAVTALDVAVKNVAGGNLQLGRDAVDSDIIKEDLLFLQEMGMIRSLQHLKRNISRRWLPALCWLVWKHLYSPSLPAEVKQRCSL